MLDIKRCELKLTSEVYLLILQSFGALVLYGIWVDFNLTDTSTLHLIFTFNITVLWLGTNTGNLNCLGKT